MSTATKSNHKTTAPTTEKDSATGKGGVHSTTSAIQGHQTGLLYAAPPVMGLGQPIQAKLTVGQPNDTYEQEADSVAEEVVTGQAETEISRLPAAPQRQPLEEEETVQTLQRQSEEKEEEPVQALQRQPLAEEEETVQAQFLQRQEDTEEEPVQAVQRQPEEGEEVPLQAQFLQRQEDVAEEEMVQPLQRQSMEEEEETLQTKFLQRQEDTEEEVQALQRQPVEEEEEPVQTLQRQSQEEEEEPVQRKTTADEETIQGLQSGVPRVSTSTEATIRNPGMGSAIPAPIRRPIEQRIGADLSGVQIHADTRAQNAAASVQARAFTHTNHIFLGPRESSSNIRLMAHEATHVVQQGAAPTIQRKPLSRATPQVQRLPDFITDRLASYARHIPGYTLFTVIIGFNPLTASRVERTAVNLLEGLMGLVPFGTAIFDKLSELGIIQDAFAWVEGQLATLDLSLSRIERLVEEAWDEMDFIRLDPFDYNLGVLTQKFEGLLNDVTTFATNLVSKIIQMIKDAAIGVAEGLLADNAAWALIKKVIHYDPLRDEPVEATTEEILADFLMLIGKEQELAQMRERGTLAETAVWLDTQIGTFLALLGQFRNLITAAWDAIQPENLPNLMTNLQTMAGQVVDLLQGVWDFATTVAAKVLELIKNALLGWLKSFATDIPGYHLLTVILGKDIFTQEEVPRTPINLIRGFMSLIPGGERQFQQMQETGVIPQAAQRIEALLSQLGISWAFVQELFLGIWNALTIEDLLAPLEAFARITAQFGEPISRLFTFVVEVIKIVLELVLQMMNFPLDIIQRIISNAMQAFEDIKRDPIGFLKNMLEAVKLGFSNFFDNILQHLLSGVTDWLFGQLAEAGINPPADFSLSSILDLVLQVLGISMDRIWEKLAERIGQENVERIRGAIDRLVGIWNFIRDVQERGVAAIWEYIESQISNLWDMVLEQARNWIVTRIIEQVTVKLLSMLDPTGIMAVVNSFIAFFKAVQSAIEYLRAMLLIVDDYVSTVAAVARGEIQPGAAKLEQGLANSIPVAIGFLANQVGLGRLADKIAEIIGSIREVVDRALDWLLDRAVTMGQALLRTLGLGGEAGSDGEADTPTGEYDGQIGKSVTFSTAGESHRIWIAVQGSNSTVMMASEEKPVTQQLDEYAGMVPNLDEAQRATVTGYISQARQLVTQLDTNADGVAASLANPENQTSELTDEDDAIESQEDQLAGLIRQIREALGVREALDIPPTVSVEDNVGNAMITNFSYANQTGTISSDLLRDSAINLTKIGYEVEGEGHQTLPIGSATVQYNIAAAHSLFSYSGGAFRFTNSEDPDTTGDGNYSQLREEFPVVMRQWYADVDSPMLTKMHQLATLGLLHMTNDSATRGTAKWRFIRQQLSVDPGSDRKEDVEKVFLQLDQSEKDRIGLLWLNHWASGTHLHHMKPLNFGGNNATSNFVPLAAGVHVGAGGVHPGFWGPLKSLLRGIKEKVEEAENANSGP